MTIINRLKNGVGEETDFYIPRNTSVLFKTKPIRFIDEEIPEDLRERNLKLLFNPDFYTIKRDAQTGKIALKNISEQTVDLPKECAHFRPSKIMPEIVYNGYLLCLDKSLEGNLSTKEKQEVLNIVNHFQKFDEQNPHEVCLHELRHLKNSESIDKLHQNGQRLSDNQFRLVAELDEISALSAEKITAETTELQALQIVRETCTDWQNNPRFETYLRPNGELDHLLSAYQEQHRGEPVASTSNMYKEIAKTYLTFKINGKDCDLSSALDARFMPPKRQTLTAQIIQERRNKHSL